MLMIFKCGHFLLPGLTHSGAAQGGCEGSIHGERPDQDRKALLWVTVEPDKIPPDLGLLWQRKYVLSFKVG